MKKITYFLLLVGGILGNVSCIDNVDNSTTSHFKADLEQNEKILKSLERTLYEYLASDMTLSKEELSHKYIENLHELGARVYSLGSSQPTLRTNFRPSDEYVQISRALTDAASHSTHQIYIETLSKLKISTDGSRMSQMEKDLVVENINFMNSFVNWMESTNNALGTSATCNGWWSCWGKCAAGVLGSGITGGIGGCATGALVGGAVGTVAPGIGNGVGVVSGCVAMGVIGGIGGALLGASSYCE
ncbi:hypothetical protein ADIS_3159 [Lunatimonas lonarensis]|uniref:Uncharacterized protein n=1 Tax=Lunatimonas lonarensis TaxID=1232681 RepID=R7ZQF4_9BACT|nr:hypothetical protein [Lunatimonas lonarensis]EON76356.1 hypothetical protein ADIS_3159 [Lunatimonas lonarensis]